MLILRWDGSSWSQAATPALGSDALLAAVSAGPGGTAWAVGSSCTPGCLATRAITRALILRWDGTVWSQAASSSPADGGHPHRRERRAGQQRLGGQLHLHARLLRPLGGQPDADHALERRHLVGRVKTHAAGPPHLPQGAPAAERCEAQC